jgi:anti-sigma B factor antagonist
MLMRRSRTQVSVRQDGEIFILDVTGYLTEDSETELNMAHAQAETHGATKLLLSFDRQSFITSSGFGLIVKLMGKARGNGQRLRIAHPSDQVRRNFTIIGLTRSIEIYPSETEALASF